MAEQFTSQITVDKTIVSLLSKFTYERSFPYALREVVSNAYDADATTARIDIDLKKDRVVIHDNGNGMTREEFDFYLRIAGQRRGKRETPKFGRKRIGQFGVGFLAILPFCDTLRIVSTTENSEEVFTADIPASRFFKQDGKAVDVGEIQVIGEITRSEKRKAEHFTEISLLRLSDITKRYFASKPRTEKKDRVTSWPPLERLRWEMQEDLPLAFPEESELSKILAYPEPIGMGVYLQGGQLQRNYSDGEIVDKGDLTVEGINFRYAIISPWKAVKPSELRGIKMRLNNVGIGPRQIFGIEMGRKYSRLHWLSGEAQIISGLDGAITLSRDAFVVTPEYEALSEKLASILRKWANYLEDVDVAARDMTTQLRGRKQVRVGSKKDIVERNIKTLTERGFTVRRVERDRATDHEPVRVDKSKKEVVVYQEHPDFEDTITIGSKKRRISYSSSSARRPSYETACRLNEKGDVEIDSEYPLFKSKRYGDVFKKIFIIATLAKSGSLSTEAMYKFILAQIDKEFKDF